MSAATFLLAAGSGFERSMPEKMRDVHRIETFDAWGTLALVALGLLAVAVFAWLRRRRADRLLDEAVLQARAVARGFTPAQRELLLEVATIGKLERPSDIVPKLTRYRRALEAYLTTIDDSDLERLEPLLETLAEMRKKLGFERLPNYRTIPSTRELGAGTVMKVRPLGRGSWTTAVVAKIHDLQMRLRLVPSGEGDRDGGDVPSLQAGDELEANFARSDDVRCHFVTTVTWPPEEDGLVVPVGHAPVRNVALRARPGDTRVEGQLRTPDGRDLAVTIVDLGGRGALVSSPIPSDVSGGRLIFSLPGTTEAVAVEVERADKDAGDVTTLEFTELPEETWRAIAARRRVPARVEASLTSSEGHANVIVLAIDAESLALDRPVPFAADRARLEWTPPDETRRAEVVVERVGDEGVLFRVDHANDVAHAAIEAIRSGRVEATTSA